jgi:hypothetical protein
MIGPNPTDLMQCPCFDDAAEIIEGANFKFVVQKFDALWPS